MVSNQTPRKRISCSRCQTKKIRCSRADPRCDKCEAAGANCIYLPRKHRTKKQSGFNDRGVLADILGRLERLEDHCGLDQNEEDCIPASRSMSFSVDSCGSKAHPSTVWEVDGSILDRIKDPGARSQLFSNLFCHIRNAESRFFENEKCIEAMKAVVAEVEHPDNAQPSESTASPLVVPKEMARKRIQQYYDLYQFEGFRIPFEKSFIMSIPDLLEIPHVQLDYTSQIVYYTILLHGIMLGSDDLSGKGGIVAYLYRKSMELTEGWMDQIKNTQADLFAAFVMISMALEGCEIELSWKILGHSCAIARALGYFSVDGDPETPNAHDPHAENLRENETEIERNRKRFEFWHLLRTDCIFRLSFGKPALIRQGSWKVNFPDPTITGVDDASTRFVQIHFLASMRLTLVLLRYLDFVDAVPEPDPTTYDSTVDGYIAEVHSITSDWSAEELFNTTTNHIDSWFCVDILLNSYKMLIVFDQSKNCNQNAHRLPQHTVDIARRSLQVFQFLMDSIYHTHHAHWGMSLILLHQFVPLFILCLDVIESCGRQDIEADLTLVVWISDFVERTAEERVELRPAVTVMKTISLVCQRVKSIGH